MLVVADYGVGNLGSLVNAFAYHNHKAEVTTDKEKIRKATHLVIPGVGSFDHVMSRLRDSDLIPLLEEKALVQKIPTLGICVGMQMFADSSEEGQLPGLSWIPGKIRKFSFNMEDRFKVPHMGWNKIVPKRSHGILKSLNENSRFYFVHSYFYECQNEANTLAKSCYGQEFSSMVVHENIVGMQFHPEKSLRHGLSLLKDFAEL